MLEVRHITKRYGHVLALNDVSFDVRAGEVLGLIGPNGAGKTTLFECLAGVLHRDAGTVATIGDAFASPAGVPSMFYVPDAAAPWPVETVRWMLDYIVGFFGGDADAIAGVVRDLDLAPLLDVRIGALSKGQRKRALVGAGLVTRSPLLMIDEPFDGLDLRQSRSLAAVLRAHASRGRTFFLSVHQIGHAARVCDRFVLLGAGSVRGEGTLTELSAAARLPSPGSPADLEEVFLALT
ncbi:MAG TPA: ABC transporter ATP-binding protein [Vicinamibacterales bacterium]|nr:ABC transporter ATP-binding protein [Vicinamibacterales bacterium]